MSFSSITRPIGSMNLRCMTACLCVCLHVCSCPISGYAQITQANTMQEVFQHFHDADAKTLAIFDVDMVLVQPSDPAFQMPNMKRFSTVAKRIMKEVPADKQMVLLSLMTLSSDPQLVDDQTPELLEQLMQRGVPTMALTANLTGAVGGIKSMEAWRIEGLKKLGIDFSKAAPYPTSCVFDQLPSFRTYYSTYVNGMLFVNGTVVSKGEALLAFLKKGSISPSKIVFVDDREENLKSVEKSLSALNSSIEYRGIHFLGASNFLSKQIEEEEFTFKWQQLASEAKNMD